MSRDAGLDEYLIAYCSPTLASLKTANLFTCRISEEEELSKQVSLWNEAFRGKGIELISLKSEKGMNLIYVCRKDRLREDLGKEGVAAFLSSYGYRSTDAEKAIGRLRERLSSSDGFPHEIGLFLGYPLSDVKGFIENRGKNAKCTGFWKVYGDETAAKKCFAAFHKCRRIYSELWKTNRKSLAELAVKSPA